ncbi:MAG: PTS sugar transporter subunit IIA [Kiritimatiellia bacterium]|nr:PTS sugar transporter subunit IIA [Lentisphaerota bacterium]
MPHRMFNIVETAAYLHLELRDLEHLVRHVEIPFEMSGNRPIFHKREIDAWASRRILGMPEKKLRAYHEISSGKAHDISQQNAIVTELMRPDQIMTNLSARTKPSLLSEMTQLADQTGLLYDARDLLASLQEREELYSTALSDGIALLHPRHHEPYMFDDSFIVLGRAPRPLPFGAPDGENTDIFFLVCCQDDRLHLHVLARLCMMCRRTRLIGELRAGADAGVMHAALVKAELSIINNR